MTKEVQIKRNPNFSAEELVKLRSSVGWTSNLEACNLELKNSYSYFVAYFDEKPIGYVNTISDKIDALINDFIIHPEYQKNGFGKKLIQFAVGELKKDGIKFFNVIFHESLVSFYKKCGFEITLGGVIDCHK